MTSQRCAFHWAEPCLTCFHFLNSSHQCLFPMEALLGIMIWGPLKQNCILSAHVSEACCHFLASSLLLRELFTSKGKIVGYLTVLQFVMGCNNCVLHLLWWQEMQGHKEHLTCAAEFSMEGCLIDCQSQAKSDQKLFQHCLQCCSFSSWNQFEGARHRLFVPFHSH